jgi:hypothetical protein
VPGFNADGAPESSRLHWAATRTFHTRKSWAAADHDLGGRFELRNIGGGRVEGLAEFDGDEAGKGVTVVCVGVLVVLCNEVDHRTQR